LVVRAVPAAFSHNDTVQVMREDVRRVV